MQVAIIKAATGYADGNGHWEPSYDIAQIQTFERNLTELSLVLN